MAKKSTQNKKKPTSKKQNKSKNKSKSKNSLFSNKLLVEEIILFTSIGFSLLLTYTFFAENSGGFLGKLLKDILLGLFGSLTYVMPILIIGLAVYYFLNSKNIKMVIKHIYLTCSLFLVTLIFIHTITKNSIALNSFVEYFSYNTSDGLATAINGGLIGALFGNLFIAIVGKFGTYILVFIAYSIIFMLYTNESVAKILGTLGITTTKASIDKTKKASQKLSSYTETRRIKKADNIKLKKLDVKQLEETERLLTPSEDVTSLDEDFSNSSLINATLEKPIPNKELSSDYKHKLPKKVANSFIQKDIKNKSLKVPSKPRTFIIAEREHNHNNITLISEEVDFNKEKTPVEDNVNASYHKHQTFNSSDTFSYGTNNTNSEENNVNVEETEQVETKNFDKQQEKVNQYYEEIKKQYENDKNNVSDYSEIINEKINDLDDVVDEKLSHYVAKAVSPTLTDDDIKVLVSDSSDVDVNNTPIFNTDTKSAVIIENDQSDNEYIDPFNFNSEIKEKIENAIVKDNVIHGLFPEYDDDVTSDISQSSPDDSYLEINSEELNDLYDDDCLNDDFDLIENFDFNNFENDIEPINESVEDDAHIDNLDEIINIIENDINDNLQPPINDDNFVNRFLVQDEEDDIEETPTLQYDEADDGKLTLENYKFPPIDILGEKEITDDGLSDVEIKENSLKLEETLKSFGVKAKVVNASRGPTVTRYEVEPGIGVKVSKIANLVDDLSLSLAASGIRIQAPIPNKPYVGIEVPNKIKDSVCLREVIDSDEFREFPSKLAFGIGKDIAGDNVIFDIGKMPHVLVAGATGSGKSVCVNTLITSIIYKAKPDEVKLLMIDPKVVELSIYNGIPHLLIPVVTDPKKANSALNWAVREMERRYSMFADNNVRNLDGYNALAIEKNYDEVMPRIVVIIDELADLMMTAAKEVEDSICRLAQKARAAGIHLIIATQRPSVDVITGLIKANIPTRMAFSVSSGIDSRTIIDTVGAERLLGRGDMLFLPYGSNEPTRVQGAFITDKEVENIVEYLSQYKAPRFSDDIITKITETSSASNSDDETDELFVDIVDFIIQKQKASASMLQSKFRIGFNRASRIIDQLEDRKFIGPTEGSKPRKVLITTREWEEIRDTF